MAIARPIPSRAAAAYYCTALSLVGIVGVVGTRGVPASAASVFARRVGGRAGPPITCAFAHQRRRSAASSFVRSKLPSSAVRRTMTTSLGASSEGLSDIGQPSKSNSKNGDDGTPDGIPNWKERIDASIAKSRKIRGSNYVQISTVDCETMEPRCRTVVFRGFLKGVPFGAVKEVLPGGDAVEAGGDREGEAGGYDCVMKMITDRRSNKVKELEKYHALERRGGNTAEMVWWFPKSSEQYRIRGRLQFVGRDGPLFSYAGTNEQRNEEVGNYFVTERKQQWGNLSDLAREQFYWQNPGVPYASTGGEGGGVPPGGRDMDGKVLPPPDTFLLMLLYPATIDYLRLGDNYRQVDEWDWDGGAVVGEGGGWKSLRVNP